MRRSLLVLITALLVEGGLAGAVNLTAAFQYGWWQVGEVVSLVIHSLHLIMLLALLLVVVSQLSRPPCIQRWHHAVFRCRWLVVVMLVVFHAGLRFTEQMMNENRHREQQVIFGLVMAGDLAGVTRALGRGAGANMVYQGERIRWLGATPLVVATAKGEDEIAVVLMSHGADVNTSDHLGMTPLMGAAVTGSPDVVRRLLDMGADPHAVNCGGQTAVDLARDSRRDSAASTVITLLERASERTD